MDHASKAVEDLKTLYHNAIKDLPKEGAAGYLAAAYRVDDRAQGLSHMPIPKLYQFILARL